jgi:hypothetical protein
VITVVVQFKCSNLRTRHSCNPRNEPGWSELIHVFDCDLSEGGRAVGEWEAVLAFHFSTARHFHSCVFALGRIAIRTSCYPGSHRRQARSRKRRIQSGSSDQQVLHRKTGTVLSIHLLLHEDSRIRPSRIRHAELFQGIAAICAPNGAHAGNQWFHREDSGPRSFDSSADSSGDAPRFGIGLS